MYNTHAMWYTRAYYRVLRSIALLFELVYRINIVYVKYVYILAFNLNVFCYFLCSICVGLTLQLVI